MHPRQFALIGGIVMLILGVAAFFPGLNTSPAEAGLPILNLETSYGAFLGLIPMNIVNKLVLIAFGVAGILCANLPGRSLPASINWSRWAFAVMALGTVLGLFSATDTLFGYWPLFGGDLAFHAIGALLAGYFGFVLSTRAMEENFRRFPEDRRKAG